MLIKDYSFLKFLFRYVCAFGHAGSSLLCGLFSGWGGSIPGSGRSPGERNCNPLQYYCLANSTDTPWGRKELYTTEQLTHTYPTYSGFKKQTQIITGLHPISHLLPPHEAPSLPCTRGAITARAFHPVINHGGTRDTFATGLEVLLTVFPGLAPALGQYLLS